MATRAFVISEQRTDGESGEVFQWTADADAPDQARGGRRAMFTGRWVTGGRQRHVRTDYPGGVEASFQVLGAVHDDQTFEGEWDDRWNFPRYAEQERERFEAMCRRGSYVTVEFEGMRFLGLISEWSFPYRKASKIGYRFTLSVSRSLSDPAATTAAPASAKPIGTSFDELDGRTQALLAEFAGYPRAGMVGDVSARLDEALLSLNNLRNEMSGAVDQSELGAPARAIEQFKRLGTQARLIQGAASGVVDELVAVKADAELGVRTALAVLNFEASTRNMRTQARLLKWSGFQIARDMEERGVPLPFRFYRPAKGESLYAIANQHYGDPAAWRLIAEANNLTVLTLEGTEFLMLPERGAG
jgi:hypothetical protein